MVEICSKVNEEVIDGATVIYNYYEDEYGVYWIRCVDMVAFLGLTEKKANELLNKAEVYDIKDFMDMNNYNSFGEQQTGPRTFITVDAVNYLIERNNKHNNLFVKSVNNLGSDTNKEEDIDEIVNNMKKCMEDCNFDALIYNSGKLYNSETGRERMDKLGIINKNIEDNLDEVRKHMYAKEARELLLLDEGEKIIIELNKKDDVWSSWWSSEE